MCLKILLGLFCDKNCRNTLNYTSKSWINQNFSHVSWTVNFAPFSIILSSKNKHSIIGFGWSQSACPSHPLREPYRQAGSSVQYLRKVLHYLQQQVYPTVHHLVQSVITSPLLCPASPAMCVSQTIPIVKHLNWLTL